MVQSFWNACTNQISYMHRTSASFWCVSYPVISLKIERINPKRRKYKASKKKDSMGFSSLRHTELCIQCHIDIRVSFFTMTHFIDSKQKVDKNLLNDHSGDKPKP